MKPRAEPEQLLEISKRCCSIWCVIGSEQIIIATNSLWNAIMVPLHGGTILALHYEEVHDRALQKQQLFQRLTAVLLPEVSSDDPDDAGLDFGAAQINTPLFTPPPMLT